MASCRLPEEIIEDILVMLPVRSIIRFKRVSKSWFDLINSSRFVCKHASQSEERFFAACDETSSLEAEDDPPPWSLDVYGYDDHKEATDPLFHKASGIAIALFDSSRAGVPMKIFLASLLQSLAVWMHQKVPWRYRYPFHKGVNIPKSHSQIDYTLPVLHCELPPTDSSFLYYLVSDCCGILCLQNRYNIALVNPSLAEVKHIANLPLVNEYFSLVGFGFDNMSMDFKVVGITGSRYVDRPQRAEVYDIRSNAWRKLDEIQLPMAVNHSSPSSSTFLNGIVHWCVATEQYFWRILTFNLSTELFHLMEIPQGWCDNSPVKACPRLFVLNQESLAFVSYTLFLSPGQSQFVNVWVRNKHGIEEKWTKLYMIGPLPQLCKPISFWKKGKFLYETKNEQLISYDLINQRSSLVFDTSQIPQQRKKCPSEISFLQMGVCGSSLISIKHRN